MQSKIYDFNTINLHNNKNIEYKSLHKPIHKTVTFCYKNVFNLIKIFKGEKKGYRYSRQSNPTISFLENKITNMEDSLYTICFSSGMSAISSTIISLIKKNDHIISSKFIFGNTKSMLNTFIKNGIKISIIDTNKTKNIINILTNKTKIIFLETISNPITQISNLKKIGKLCKKKHIIYLIDNTITSPYTFKPKIIGASLIINSLTKIISGHSTVLGGSLTDTGLYNWKLFSNIQNNYKKYFYKKWGVIQIRAKGLRDLGGSLSPDSAYNIYIGSETLTLRQNLSCNNSLKLSKFLINIKKISKIYYPGLKIHPKYSIAKNLFKNFGNIISIKIKKNLNYLKFLNNLNICLLASNLGDTRTLIIPISQTIYYELGKKCRYNMKISNSLIRISVGIENIKDLIYDFKQAFKNL